MKRNKLFSLILAAALPLTLAACGERTAERAAQPDPEPTPTPTVRKAAAATVKKTVPEGAVFSAD